MRFDDQRNIKKNIVQKIINKIANMYGKMPFNSSSYVLSNAVPPKNTMNIKTADKKSTSKACQKAINI
jgi:hypothetical protein